MPLDESDGQLMGLNVLTDCKWLVETMQEESCKDNPSELAAVLEARFPGILTAIIEGTRQVESNRVRATHMFYFSFRVQIWGLGFDADPSACVRVVPINVATELDDDTSKTLH